MLQAFLFDFKREISAFKTLKDFGLLQWIALISLLLVIGLFIWAMWTANLIFIICTVVISILTVNFFVIPQLFRYENNNYEKGKNDLVCSEQQENQNGSITSDDTKTKSTYLQLRWFQTHRVEIVNKIISDKVTGMSKEKCIKLLLEECDLKLKETRPSAVAKKRIAPILAPIGIVFTTLSTAYLNKVSLVSESVEGTASLDEWFLEILKELGSSIISDDVTFTLFIVVCIYLIVFYLSLAFVILPIVISIIDRDWLLTAELKSILHVIQNSDMLIKDDLKAIPEKKETSQSNNVSTETKLTIKVKPTVRILVARK